MGSTFSCSNPCKVPVPFEILLPSWRGRADDVIPKMEKRAPVTQNDQSLCSEQAAASVTGLAKRFMARVPVVAKDASKVGSTDSDAKRCVKDSHINSPLLLPRRHTPRHDPLVRGALVLGPVGRQSAARPPRDAGQDSAARSLSIR